VQLRRSPTPRRKKLWLGWRRHRKRTRNAWSISKGSCRFCIRNMADIDVDLLRRQLDRIEASGGARIASTDGGNGALPPPGTWLGWRASVDARLDGLKGFVDGMRWVIGLVAVVMIGGFSFFGLQLSRPEGRVDPVGGRDPSDPGPSVRRISCDALRDGRANQCDREFDYGNAASTTAAAANHCSARTATCRKAGQTIVSRQTWKNSLN